MNTIFFSIVIPTMDRHETLPFTIRTCLNQNYDNFEIVVSDNCSSPETRAAVEALGSERVRYLRTEKRLAMTDSFEFAVSHARGDYLIVLGDDDALLPHALHELNRIISLHRPQALRWDRVYYSWPSIVPVQYAGQLLIPSQAQEGVVRIKSADILKKVADYRLDYQLLPMLYNSAVSRELIEQLKQRTGRVFQSRSPDVYSGFALAFLSGEYLSVTMPMTINAGSAKSNGVAGGSQGEGSAITAGFIDLNSASGIYIHAKVPDVLGMPVTIADSFLVAKDALFADRAELSLDRKRLVENLLEHARSQGGAYRANMIAAVQEYLKDDARLAAWFKGPAQELLAAGAAAAAPDSFERGLKDGYLRLQASDFGAVDVNDVAQLCNRIMGYTDRRFDWSRCLTLTTLPGFNGKIGLVMKVVAVTGRFCRRQVILH